MHFIVFIGTVDQEFSHGPVRMACLSFTLSDASAGQTGSESGWGWYHLEAAVLTHVWWLMLAVGWDLSWNCQPEHLPGPSVWPGASSWHDGKFQEQAVGFLRPVPGNLDNVTYTVFT